MAHHPPVLRTAALALLVSASALGSPATPAGALAETPVLWKGQDHSAAELPREVGAGALAAVSTWAAWADANDYRMVLNEDGRVLLLVHERHKRVYGQLELIDETVAYVDRVAPTPVARGRATTTGGAEEAGGPRDDGTWSYSWSEDGPELETETAVLVRAREGAHYVSALDVLAGKEEYLQGWAQGAKSLSGFVLERPLCAAYLEKGNGSEEWDPDNELVHRLAQLLLSRRFGQQPFWTKMGFAWHVEMEIRDSIYCYPYRDEFVFTAEHSAWEKDLRNLHKKVDALEMSALSDWKRGSYDPDHARRAFGLASFVAAHHPDALSDILEDLRLLRDEKGIVRDGQNWQRIPGWEASADDQLAIFQEHLGQDFLDELLEYFQKGKKYRP